MNLIRFLSNPCFASDMIATSFRRHPSRVFLASLTYGVAIKR